MSILYQDVQRSKLKANECDVPPNDNACLLLWERGCSRVQEARFAGRSVALDLLPGEGIFMPPGIDSRCVSSAETYSGIMHFHLHPGFINRIMAEANVPFDIAAAPLQTRFFSPAVLASARWLFAEARAAPPSALLWDSASVFLSMQLARSLNPRLTARAPHRGGLAAWQLRRVNDYMAHNFSRDITLADLADLTGLSVFHFARAYRQSTGVTPHARLVQLRIAHARQLLARSQLSIMQIALDVGYESPQSLARAFSRQIGMSPSAYRRGV